MMLVDGTVAASATRVCEVASDGSLEEALASLASELSVMLAARLVTANDAFYTRLLAAVTTAATCFSSRIIKQVRNYIWQALYAGFKYNR